MSVSVGVRSSLGLLLVVCLACGDDGGDDTPSPDAGSKDAGPVMDSGQGIPKVDAQVNKPDPIKACAPTDPAGCGGGETCDLLVRFTADGAEPRIYTGCVPSTRERGAGDPCDPDPTNNTPVRLPGLVDDVYRDECGPGLVCAPSRSVRNGFSCQIACSSDPAQAQACSGTNTICFPATGFSEYCRESEGCDAMKQTGCLAGEACFLVWSNDERRLLSVCSPPVDMPKPNGDATCNPLTCNPGSACLGPVHLPIARWTRADVKCRSLCTESSASGADAGADDAGVGRGSCSGASKCEPFSESGLILTSIPRPPYGQCEP